MSAGHEIATTDDHSDVRSRINARRKSLLDRLSTLQSPERAQRGRATFSILGQNLLKFLLGITTAECGDISGVLCAIIARNVLECAKITIETDLW